MGREPAEARVEELVIRSLSLPKVTSPRGGDRISRFDLGELHALVDRADMRFTLVSVDDRGRVSGRAILEHQGWTPRSPLTVAQGRNFLVVHENDQGTPLVDNRMRICLPDPLLRLCGLTVGSPAMTTATGVGGVLIVHPVVNLSSMMRQFHQFTDRHDSYEDFGHDA